MKKSQFSFSAFFSFLLLIFSFPSFSQVTGIDQRAKKYYSSSQLASMSVEKITKINHLFRNSFEIKKGDKVCAACPDINAADFDVMQFANSRHYERDVVVFASEPGYPVILKPYKDLVPSAAPSNQSYTPDVFVDATSQISFAFSDNQERVHTYRSEFGKGIRIEFQKFRSEPGIDLVMLYDGQGINSKLLAVYSGIDLPPSVTTTSQFLTIRTVTDGSVNFEGVDATVSAVSPFTLPPPNSQDCQGAIPVCQSVFTQPVSYSGTGNVPNEINSSINCLLSGEKNDVWYQFTVQTSGILCFSITPNNFTEDYDWAVYDLTNANCSDIYNNAALQVSCNYSGAGGTTGANGQGGSQNNPCMNVVAGQSFVLNVSNFSSSQNGYTLDFSSSTAQLFDNVPPQINSVVVPVCGATSLTFNFSENILCSTVSAADFNITGPGGPYSITSISGAGCTAGAPSENTFTVTLSQPLTVPGNYSICLNNTAGSVTDLCNNVAPPGCLNFAIADITAGFAPVATQCLTGNSFSFTNTSTSTAVGTMTYSWSFPGASPSTSTAINPTGVSWSAAGTYTVSLTVTQGSCSETYTQNVSVLLPATAGSASTTPAFICAGTCSNLTLTGYQGSIQWQSSSNSGGPYTDIPGGTTTPFQVCPTSITYYRANVLGCSNAVSNYVQITVNPAPNVQIANHHQNICQGATTTINATGAAIYTWNPGPVSGANLTVSPTSTTTYTVTGTSSGCRDTAIAIVQVSPLPVVTAGADLSTCQGSPVTITATGAAAYSWSPATGLSSTTGAVVSANPSATITYTITGTTSSNCISYDTIVVNVLPPPVANAGTDVQMCSNSSVTLNATGGTSYSWSPAGSLDNSVSQTVTATPATTTTYTVTAAIGSCTSTDEVIVNVVQVPVTDAGSDMTICSGTSAILSATGATDYSWSPLTALTPPDGLGASVVASPLVTTTYTVTGSNSGCISIDEVIINVIQSPLTNAGADKFICIGQSDTLYASGAISYQWSPSAGLNTTSGPVVIASPAVTTTYTVTGSDNVCSLTDLVVVNVQSGIVVTASADVQICSGDTADIFVTGALSYNWTPATGLSSVTDSVLTATPVSTTTYTVTGTTNGCYGSDEIIVTVNNAPLISAGSDVAICFGSQVTLNATGAQSYSWNPVAGLNDPTSSSPAASPAITTTYTLTGTSSAGCISFDTVIVFVNDLPVANFDVQENCEYAPLVFNDVSVIGSGNITNWFWDFGDNSNSALQHPVHQYNSPGQYVVTLVVQSDAIPSCAAVVTKTVNVFPKPVAAFSSADVCEENEMAFTNSSTVASGSITSSSWTFGDGNVSGLDSPENMYSNEGSYTVQLIVTSDKNCTDTVSSVVNVFEKPVAAFSSDSVCIGSGTTFINTSSATSSPISSYDWNFGDSEVSGSVSPVHTYASSGTFSSVLIITTSEGCKDTALRNVVVHAAPVAGFTTESVCLGESTDFTDNSSVDSPSSITQWSWNFGDGNSSSFPAASNTYATSGVFTVELAVESNYGCKDTAVAMVTVHTIPVARIYSAVSSGCAPLCISFRDTSSSSAPVSEWSWNFSGTEGTSTDQYPVNCFEAGEYDVVLKVTSTEGCVDESEPFHISSHALPVAMFTYGPENVNILNPLVTFSDLSTGATSWTWNFGDSTVSTFNVEKDVIEHEFRDTGIFCIDLLVINEFGCRDSIEQCLTVEPDFVMYTPNAFTPNGDGKNDVFMPVATGIDEKKFEFRIFDRWGNLTYFTNDLYKGWNGRFNNTGNEVPEDTYVYIIYFRDLDGNPKRAAGKVTVLR